MLLKGRCKYDLQQMPARKTAPRKTRTQCWPGMTNSACDKTNDDFDMDDMMVTKAARKKNEELEEAKKLNKAAHAPY